MASYLAMPTKTRGFFVRLILLAIIFFAFLLLYNKDVEQPTEQVDNSTALELVQSLEKELPEVDFSYWYNYAKPGDYRLNWSCAHYPDPLDLQFHNFYWQTFINHNVTFRLYSAYLDKRPATNSSRGLVRILTTANQIGNKFPNTHCQLWYLGYENPIIVPVIKFTSVWPLFWDHDPLLNYAHLLSCQIPDVLPINLEESTPSTVSLTTQVCEHASNSLRVHYEVPDNTPVSTTSSMNVSSKTPIDIGVCLKAFDFPFVDLSGRLVEWFELQRLLGATRIYAYSYNIHPEMQRILEYYQQTGFLELRPMTMANGFPNLPHLLHMLIKNRILVKRLNELIPYNDCFYRNMYRHDYMLNVDIDEVILPMGELRTWQELLGNYQEAGKFTCPNGFDSLCFIESQFVINNNPRNPNELFFLQNTMRKQNYTKENLATKCFHNTRYSLTLHNHYTLTSLPGACPRRFLGTHLAQMQHYKTSNSTELIEDRSIWKFAPRLRAAVKNVLKHLKK